MGYVKGHFLMQCAGAALAVTQARAGDSFVLPDKVSRAPGVTLHCTNDGVSAVPCGTVGQPLVVNTAPGAATASNQSAELAIEQNMVGALGTSNDIPYQGNGPGSVVAVLKALSAAALNGIEAVPVGGTFTSRSVSIATAGSMTLFAVNTSRHYLAFQAPQATGIWVNMLGGVATPNGLDCAYFPPGSFYESGQFINRGSITVYAPVAATISAWEG